MTKETLKKLIEVEFDRVLTISEFKQEVFRLIDLYDVDNLPTLQFMNNNPVKFGDICSCNPSNGGDGICRCSMNSKTII